MSFDAGTKLGTFEITGLLGKGGMGEVYRARDTKLGREVAIKVLPDALAGDPERLARFEREAAILASLDHPNIGAIYDLQHSGDVHFLVMQLVEGETLAERLESGPLPPHEAISIFLQIAEGLEEAHNRGIVHRDLKPANIKVDDAGRVRILDFGIAKPLFEDDAPAPVSSTAETVPSTPTPLKSITGTAVLIGTPSYMSPEQARGRRVDRRTDIWAFGCCLYEALTGIRPFEGDTIADIVTEVLRTEPDFSNLPPETPAALRVLLRRCLEKDPKRRLRDIGEAWLLLEAPDDLGPLGETVSPRRSRGMLLMVVSVMLGAAVIALAGGVLWGRSAMPADLPASLESNGAPESPVYRFAIQLPPDEELSLSVAQSIDIAPDGSAIVYSSQKGGELKMNVQPLDAFSRHTLTNITDVAQPYISPDGRSIVTRRPRGTEAEMVRVPLYGGNPSLVAVVPGIQNNGADWAADGYMYYMPALGDGIWRISADGGQPELVVEKQAGEMFIGYPQLLPDERHLLYSVVQEAQGGAARHVYVQDLETGDRKHVLRAGFARYVPTGHLLYVPMVHFGSTLALYAAPFDLKTLEVTGDGVSVLDDVSIHVLSNIAHIAVADNGTLAYVPRASTDRQPVWVGMDGSETPLKLSAGVYGTPRIAPDGSSVLLSVGEGNSSIWELDLESGLFDRLIREDGSLNPLWMFDGEAIAYNAISEAGVSLKLHRLRSAEPAVDISGAGELQWPASFAGGMLATSFIAPGKLDNYDIQVFKLHDDLGIEPIAVGFNSSSVEGPPALSRDGQWAAFTSMRAGFWRIYLARVSENSEVYPVSSGYGVHPAWAPDQSAIYFQGAGHMAKVPIAIEGDSIEIGQEESLFETGPYEMGDIHQPPNYDISPDGTRFLMLKRVGSSVREMGQINVVLNWFDELNRLVPTVEE